MASRSTGWSTSATTSISRREEHTWWTITQLGIPGPPFRVVFSKAQSSPAQGRGAERKSGGWGKGVGQGWGGRGQVAWPRTVAAALRVMVRAGS